MFIRFLRDTTLKRRVAQSRAIKDSAEKMPVHKDSRIRITNFAAVYGKHFLVQLDRSYSLPTSALPERMALDWFVFQEDFVIEDDEGNDIANLNPVAKESK